MEVCFSIGCLQTISDEVHGDTEIVAAWCHTVILLGWGFKIGSKNLLDCKYAALNMTWERLVDDFMDLYNRDMDNKCELEFDSSNDPKNMVINWKNYKATNFSSPSLSSGFLRKTCAHMFYMVMLYLRRVQTRVLEAMSHEDNNIVPWIL